jgi:hypothetical protein
LRGRIRLEIARMQRFKFTLRQELLACCGGLSMVALLGSIVAYWTTDRMGVELDRIAVDASQKLDAVGEFGIRLLQKTRDRGPGDP